VLGGGIIGLEMATVYQALGSKITVVDQISIGPHRYPASTPDTHSVADEFLVGM
jgi:pyruvate/2-oxoglutarate dehydrogenase complex dihydrolipoamide dehydrogenase (E3) component